MNDLSWATFVAMPLLFVLLNAIALGSTLSLSHVDRGLARFLHNSSFTFVIMVADSMLLFLGSYWLENRFVEETSTSLLVKTCLEVEKIFHGTVDKMKRKPKRSVIISTFNLLATFCAAAAATCFVFSVFARSSQAKAFCYNSVAPNFQKKLLPGIPKDLQRRLKHDHGADDRGMFAHMTDGSTFFAANNHPPSMLIGDINSHLTSPTSLILASTEGEIHKYTSVEEPRLFRQIRGGQEPGPSTEEFCFVFSQEGTTKTRLTCIRSKDTLTFFLDGDQRSPMLNPLENGWFMNAESADVEDGYYWYGRRYSQYKPLDAKGREFGTIEATEFYRVDPELMTLDLVDEFRREIGKLPTVVRRQGECRDHLTKMVVFAVAPVLLLSGLWLFSIQRMPAGVVSAIGSTAITVDLFLPAWMTPILSMAAVGCVLLLTLRKSLTSFSRETLVWILYSAVLCVVVDHGMENSQQNVSTIAFTTTIAFLFLNLFLSHPVLQVVGWVSGSTLVLCGILSLLIGLGVSASLLVIVGGLVIGFGFVGLGEKLMQFHNVWLEPQLYCIEEQCCHPQGRLANLYKLSRKSSYDGECDLQTTLMASTRRDSSEC